MDLWIRSQDKKRLINADGLIEHLNEIWVYEPKEDYSLVVGTYDTKERALEVLDEIQNIIDGDYTYYDIKDNTIKNCNKVYEMPKE